MSLPNIPNITPDVSLTRSDVVNLLLASIALEELGLAHVVNAEAEKLQAVLGTLPNSQAKAENVSQLLDVNNSVNRMLRTVLEKQMLLEFKLEDIVAIPLSPPTMIFKNTGTVTALFDNVTVTASDDAYYHTVAS